MNEFDDIEGFYKEILNEFSVEGDSSGWSRLENNLDITDKGIETWYKDKTENFIKVPVNSIWDDLSMQLDTESVWRRLLNSLDKRDRIIWWWKFVVGSFTFLLACFLILTFYPDSTFKKKKYVAINESNKNLIRTTILKKNRPANLVEQRLANKLQLFRATIKEEGPNKQETPNDVNNKNHVRLRKEEDIVNTVESRLNEGTENLTDGVKNIEIQSGVITYKDLGKSSEQYKFLNLPASYINSELYCKISPLENFTFNNDSIQNIEKEKKYLYVKGGVLTPWLLNSDTYTSFRSNSNDYNKTIFKGVFGVGYVHWLTNFGIETVISYKEKGHSYMLYVEGESFKKEIKLNYVDFNLRLKKKLTKNNFKSTTSSISGGLYYGRIIHQYLILNGLSYSNFSEYSKNDFGLSFSYESNLPFNKKNISAELTLSQGLSNIYRGNGYVNFNKTYNSTIAISIKYRLLKQK